MRSIASACRLTSGLCRHRHEIEEAEGEEHVTHLDAAPRAAGRRFALPGSRRHYERDRPFLIRHIALELEVDLDKKRISGSARLDVTRVDERATVLVLDAISFDVQGVSVDGHDAAFAYDDKELRITLDPAVTQASVTVRYAATPRRGLYFLSPDEHTPGRPVEMWSQCQDEDARHFFPCHDKPHIKQTTEMVARVPRGLYCLSNGKLVKRHDDGAHSVFHYVQKEPHASYLVTLVVGDFVELAANEPTRIPVTYLIPKGREADGERTFARTPAMIRLFEEKTGVPFAYAKYAQIVVHDFVFGGMENTSATTMYEHILLDERAAIDVDMDGLVAHELAHQWFGDLVTCRDFSEAWLNEGWATYMELVWKDEGTEPGAGRDEYDYAVKGELDVYLDEDASRYRRPIVCRDYEQPIELFDRHLYQKGALVLHAIRRTIGDSAFWAGVKAYLQSHAHGVVETRDLQRALEATSGRSLDRLFDTYVFGSGHPTMVATITVEGVGSPTLASVTVKQTQHTDDTTRLYEGPLVVELSVDGNVTRHTMTLKSATETFAVSVSRRPDYVTLDPDGDLLASIEVDGPLDLVRGQLARGARPRSRWMAANQLRKHADGKTVDALGAALANRDEFWGVRAEAAQALGEIRTAEAGAALTQSISTPHAKVRRAIVRALGKFKDRKALDALRPVALSDASYLVASDAARAMGQTRQADAFDTLVELLTRSSWSDVVRTGALEGLAALRDERAVPHVIAASGVGRDSHGRRAALVALARLDTTRKTRELLEERLDDPDMFVRQAAIRGLDILSDVRARTALSRRLEREDSGGLRRRLRETLRDLRGSREAEIRTLRDDLERVRDETKDLKARLATIEAKVSPSSSDPPGTREGHRAKKQKRAKAR